MLVKGWRPKGRGVPAGHPNFGRARHVHDGGVLPAELTQDVAYLVRATRQRYPSPTTAKYGKRLRQTKRPAGTGRPLVDLLPARWPSGPGSCPASAPHPAGNRTSCSPDTWACQVPGEITTPGRSMAQRGTWLDERERSRSLWAGACQESTPSVPCRRCEQRAPDVLSDGGTDTHSSHHTRCRIGCSDASDGDPLWDFSGTFSSDRGTSEGLSAAQSGKPLKARKGPPTQVRGPFQGEIPGGADESAYTPGSVSPGPCGPRGGGHPSRAVVAGSLVRSTRGLGRAALDRPRRVVVPFGMAAPLDLAPGGVYLALRVTSEAGGLLHHRFTLTWTLRSRRSVFCGTVPRVTPGGRYPPPCPVEPGRSSGESQDPHAAARPARPPCRPCYLYGRRRGPTGRRASAQAGAAGRKADAARVPAASPSLDLVVASTFLLAP